MRFWTGEARNSLGEEGIMVEGEKLHAAVDCAELVCVHLQR
jgi:hypothetical protein